MTFWYDHDGFPTAVTDKNGNTLSFTLSAVQPGDDPGGPEFHVTQVTDAAGQGPNPAPNRSFNINYFTKQTAKKPQMRGKVASIPDHLGHQFSFSYYDDDGNLLSITEQGGSNADGSPLASDRPSPGCGKGTQQLPPRSRALSGGNLTDEADYVYDARHKQLRPVADRWRYRQQRPYSTPSATRPSTWTAALSPTTLGPRQHAPDAPTS